MTKMSKSMFYVILGIMLLIGADFFIKPDPKYKVNECAIDQIHGDTRKITKVKEYIYNYCKLVDNKCDKYYLMRIKDFDRIMEKTNCKETK